MSRKTIQIEQYRFPKFRYNTSTVHVKNKNTLTYFGRMKQSLSVECGEADPSDRDQHILNPCDDEPELLEESQKTYLSKVIGDSDSCMNFTELPSMCSRDQLGRCQLESWKDRRHHTLSCAREIQRRVQNTGLCSLSTHNRTKTPKQWY